MHQQSSRFSAGCFTQAPAATVDHCRLAQLLTSPSALTRPPFILQTASATWESCWTVHSPCGSILRRSRQRAFSTSVDFADYAVFSTSEPKAVGVRVRFDAHRILQRRSRQHAGQCTRSTAASATRSSSVCGWLRATRSCHVYTHFVALVTNRCRPIRLWPNKYQKESCFKVNCVRLIKALDRW